MTCARPPFPRPHAAFSLVEVTVALGIVTFAVVAVLGVIPTGMNTLRDATRDNVEAQIVRTVAGQLNAGTFTGLNTNVYYDVDGVATADANLAVFTVSASNQTTAPSYPGSSNLKNLTNFLKTVRLGIKIGATTKTNFYSLSVAQTEAANAAP